MESPSHEHKLNKHATILSGKKWNKNEDFKNYSYKYKIPLE